MSSYDFRAQQVKTGKLIVSSSTEDVVPNRLLIYPVEVDGTPSGQGNINQVTFATSSIGSDVYVHFYGSNTKVVSFGGKTKFSSSVISLGGFSGSHQFLTDGTTPAFVAGPNISVNLNVNGAVAISGSASGADPSASYLLTSATASLVNSRLIASGVGIELTDNGLDKLIISSRLTPGNNVVFASGTNGAITISSLSSSIFSVNASLYAKTTSSVSFDTSGKYTNQVGSDVYFFVSGDNSNAAVFQGRVNVSGSLKAHSGISGSLQRLMDGTPAFVPGPNILIATQSNGAVEISASIPATYQKFYITLSTYSSTVLTSSVIAGESYINPTEVPTSSIVLRNTVNAVTSSNKIYVQLFNLTSGSYVHIGGAGITVLTSSATSSVKLESVNLASATNWSGMSAIYQTQFYSSSSSYPVILGSSQLVFS